MKIYKGGDGKDKVLVLRTCNSDMSSMCGFYWPEEGPVECPDWDPTPECGHGLHGLLDGRGSGAHLCWNPQAQWLAVEVNLEDLIQLFDELVKFPRGIVVHCGPRKSTVAYFRDRGYKYVVGYAYYERLSAQWWVLTKMFPDVWTWGHRTVEIRVDAGLAPEYPYSEKLEI